MQLLRFGVSAYPLEHDSAHFGWQREGFEVKYNQVTLCTLYKLGGDSAESSK